MGLPDDERERMIEYLSTVNDLLDNRKIHPKDISLIARAALNRTGDFLIDAYNFYSGVPKAIAREGIKFINYIVRKTTPQKDEIDQLKYLLKLLQPYDTLLPRLNSRA